MAPIAPLSPDLATLKATLTLVGAVVLGAVAGWQLWTAFTRGQVRSRWGGTLSRAAQPWSFWATVAVSALWLVATTAGLGALAYRTLVPPPLAQRQAAFYPSRAMAQKIGGLVILHCTVTTNYGLKDCSVASESPPGMGFGASALQISALQQLPAKDRSRAQPGDPINLPIRFRMPDPQR